MSNIQQNNEDDVNFKIFKELVDFEKELSKTRKRTRDADFLDRKLVISDSTEFERHFESLSEAIARLLPYHTFYTDEIKFNLINEDEAKIQERKKRIKKVQDSIMEIGLSNSSLIFNASKYGFVRLLYSSFALELEKNKRELSQKQALELNWKYPIDVVNNSNSNNGNVNYINNKQYINNNNITLNTYKSKQFEHINSHNNSYTDNINNNMHQTKVPNFAPKYYIDPFPSSFSSSSYPSSSNNNLKAEHEIIKDYNHPNVSNSSQHNFQKQVIQPNLPINDSTHFQQRQQNQLNHVSNSSLPMLSLNNDLPKI
ncbi:synaptobrevin synaptobrevin [Cryptosporidium xiaoi]|uniref:Synaptobrevin synaptobrevin n=1 Tax=Cryptosporidium xiaoi TaxID=659607 RepID=A0AAV9Y098_9CRYT